MEDFANSLNRIMGKAIKENEPLYNKCTFKIGGKCRFYVEVKSFFQLNYLIKLCKKHNVNWFLLGAGSNVLFPDYFSGVIISLKNFNKILIKGTTVFAGAGVFLPYLCNFLKDKNLGGLEWASGIPASVGGAVKMNAGAFDNQILDFVKCIYVYRKRKIRAYFVDKNKYGYRHNGILRTVDVVLGVDFVLNRCKKQTIEKKMQQVFLKRFSTQNVGFASAGSVFKRTKTAAASKLIDIAGLKGLSVGDAMVSPVHSGYIVNKGNATQTDVLKLIKKIRKQIFNLYNEKLELEICVIKNS